MKTGLTTHKRPASLGLVPRFARIGAPHRRNQWPTSSEYANVYLQTGLFLRIREKGGVFRLVMVDKDSKTKMVWPINESYDSLANALSGANDLLVKLGCFTDLDK